MVPVPKAFDRIRQTLSTLPGRGDSAGSEDKPDGEKKVARTAWKFLGKPVCVSAWKKLHGLGTQPSLVHTSKMYLWPLVSTKFLFP